MSPRHARQKSEQIFSLRTREKSNKDFSLVSRHHAWQKIEQILVLLACENLVNILTFWARYKPDRN